MSDLRPKVFLVDDHAGMRDSLSRFIDDEFEVIGTVATAEEALEDARIAQAAVVLVDISLPGMNGIDLVEALLRRRPALRCLMLSGHSSLVYVKRALAAGAVGFLRKESPLEIIEGIRHAIAGHVFLGPELRRRLAEDEVAK